MRVIGHAPRARQLRRERLRIWPYACMRARSVCALFRAHVYVRVCPRARVPVRTSDDSISFAHVRMCTNCDKWC